MGPARIVLLNPADWAWTAYHEAGHALLALVLPGGPRCMACRSWWGPPTNLPVDDRTSYGQDYLRTRNTWAMGGRAAEALIYGVTTTGAETTSSSERAPVRPNPPR